jgi:pyrroline-5-carboxylate reductase
MPARETIGILGAGSLAGFLVAGIRRAQAPYGVVVSPRNAGRARQLAQDFGVAVAADNQEVVARAGLVIVALLPQDAEAVLGGVRFRPGQPALSVMAGIAPSRFAQLASPASSAAAMMPGRANAWCVGPSVLHPELAEARVLLQYLGPVLALAEERQFLAASVFGGYSGLTLLHMAEVIGWFERQGLPAETARRLVAATVRGNAQVLLADPESLEALLASITTPGGITELGRAVLEANAGLAAWDQALEAIHDRILGAPSAR